MFGGTNESVPVCLAIDRIRQATQEQTLAFLYANGGKIGIYRSLGSGDRVGYTRFRRENDSFAMSGPTIR